MDVAVEIWNDLKTRYSQGDLSRISDLQLEVASAIFLSLTTLPNYVSFGMS